MVGHLCSLNTFLAFKYTYNHIHIVLYFLFSLSRIGIRSLKQLQNISEEAVGSLTSEDLSFSEYQKLRSGVTKLQQYQEYEDGLKMVELEMLSHHKMGFVRNSYSWAGIIRIGKESVVFIYLIKSERCAMCINDNSHLFNFLGYLLQYFHSQRFQGKI